MPRLLLDKEELAKMEGTWQVISVNLPGILAEKESVRKIFSYFESLRDSFIFLLSLPLPFSNEKDIRPGWIIEVDKEGFYHFFPPPTHTADGKSG